MTLTRQVFRFAATSILFGTALQSCARPIPPAPVAHASAAAPAVPPARANSRDPDQRARELVAQMTLEEKVAYIGGERDFYLRPIPRLGLPEFKFADGPVGCRNWGPSTAYPATIGLAATFDDDLALRVGKSMARDSRARGVHVLLAPGVNIQRAPITGRNFEYLGEDPMLAGAVATELVKGIQSEGVVATVKHFAANNQEWDRNHISSEVDERTLREIYLPAFERVVRDGQVGAVMSSYNLLNGIYASHHPWLLKSLLKGEWGFRGFVMSDWFAVHDAVGGALGGCDLEMPKAVHMTPANLQAMLTSGTLPQAELDDKLRRILRTLIAAGSLDRPQLRKDIPLDDPASRAVALEAARKSLVLLKNEGQVLPFDPKKVRRIAVVGPNAHPLVHGGAGSAYVTPLHAVSLKDALTSLVPDVRFTYHPGIQHRSTYSNLGAKVFAKPIREEIFLGKGLEGAPVAVREVERIDFDPEDGVAPAPGVGHEGYSIRWTGEVEVKKAGKHDVMTNADDGIRVFVDGKKVLDDWSDHAPRMTLRNVVLAQGRHRVVVEYFQGTLGAIAQFGLGPSVEGVTAIGADTLDRAVADVDAVVVCLGFGQNAATNSLAREFNGFWPPGWAREANLVEGEDSDRQFGLPEPQLETLRRVLQRNRNVVVIVNAGGGVDFAGWLDQVPGLLWAFYPGQEGGTATAEVLFGRENPSGKMPMTLARRYEDHPAARYYKLNEGGKTPYAEGRLVGYRGFDAAGITPTFPFGYGLSYTSFSYSAATSELAQDSSVTVSFAVKNQGARGGSEVAQVYVEAPVAPGQPPQALAGYARVTLAPGEEKRVSITLPPRAFAHWDQGWKIRGGRYTLHVAASSRDRKASLPVDLAAKPL